MTTLDVDRMTVALQLPEPDGPDGRAGTGLLHDVDRVVRRVAGEGLARRLGSAALPAEGEWCVRRVENTLTYQGDGTDWRLEEDWADSVLAALVSALAGSSGTGWAGESVVVPEVWHYRHRDDAVVDMVTSLSRGRPERSWAWRQLGLLDADPDGATLVAALRTHPHLALSAVRAAVGAGGATGLHRLLGGAGWAAVAALAAEAAGHAVDPRTWSSWAEVDAPVGGAEPNGGVTAPAGRLPTAQPVVPADPRDASPSSGLLEALHGSGVRPDRGTAVAWAVLVLLDADPGALARPDARQRAAALADHLARAGDGRDLGLSSEGGSRAARPTPAETPPDSRPETPPGPDARLRASAEARPEETHVRAEEPTENTVVDPSRETAWGGLPFLLASAGTAGLPGLLDDPRLARRDTRWLVHRAAGLLVAAAPDDPARLALCGLPPSALPPAGPEPASGELAALTEVSEAWAGGTLSLLTRQAPRGDDSAYAGLEAFEAVRRLASRYARISGEQGRIDVVLRLDEVDVDVRVAGLDLDPGWVPWLGVVVRYRYE
jgi:hypothetical protein